MTTLLPISTITAHTLRLEAAIARADAGIVRAIAAKHRGNLQAMLIQRAAFRRELNAVLASGGADGRE